MDIKESFEKRGQGHLFAHWENLNDEERKHLLEQAGEIDLDEQESLVATLVRGQDGQHGAIDFDSLKPAPYESLPSNSKEKARWDEAKRKGEEALRAGKVAAFTVAGGQGTRLGYDGPKGTFPVSPIKRKSLFQIFSEKLLAARRRYGCALPWFIMTSHVNHDATVAFFEESDYFGLGSETVTFFKQGRMPAVDFEGKILLEDKASIAMSPDGHGGSLRALERSGALASMKKAGIEILSYFQVDNPLVQAIDACFIGFHLMAGSEMSSKMLPKAYEKEKLGHFCSLGDRLVVVEYSDMPDELTAQRDDEGSLRFIAGSIAIHVISVDFIEKVTSKGSGMSLPFHKAEKKIACLDSAGKLLKPESPNGIKFEMFVFDALPFASNPVVIETTRLKDFSPVKNASGVDSPESCVADQQKLFASWLAAVGVALPLDENGQPSCRIEVSPLFGYDEETFSESWRARHPNIEVDQGNYLE